MTFMVVHACQKQNPVVQDTGGEFESVNIPKMIYPADNEYTQSRWELGKKLFYDKALSIDSTVSCASCHLPSHAFSDPRKVSIGVNGKKGTRNSPSLANIGYHPYFTREGGVPSLEMQVLVPIQEHNEFGFNILEIEKRLSQNKEYDSLSKKAYNRSLNYYSLVRSIATFERSLISTESAYDDYVFNKNPEALSQAALRGKTLFFSDRTNCFSCHGGFNFTDYSFKNNGLYASYTDPGRSRLTGKDTDKGVFKVASLRNVEVTAPYMHDGSLASLQEVIAHYNEGGKGHVNRNSLIRPLNLSKAEMEDLEAFLLSLTDYKFLNNKKFQP